MDFEWSALQREVHGETRSRVAELVADPAWEGSDWRERWRSLTPLGVHGLPVPESYGGRGLDAVTTASVAEALGYACDDMGLVFSVLAHQLACAVPILEHGCETIRQRWLPCLSAGTAVGANALTEPAAGSDIAAIRTEAARVDDHYVLSGEKSWVTNGPVADVLLVYAKTTPSHGSFGLSAFAVAADSPGVTRTGDLPRSGLSSAPACVVSFADCEVPASARLGEEGDGSAIFRRSMNWERSCLFAAYLGAMQRQLEEVVAYARERRQFGRRIARFQAVSHRIVEMRLRLDSARLLLYRGCWALDRACPSAEELIALGKLSVSEASVASSLDAIQIRGGAGIRTDDVQQLLPDAVPTRIFSGTSDVMREIVARHMGL